MPSKLAQPGCSCGTKREAPRSSVLLDEFVPPIRRMRGQVRIGTSKKVKPRPAELIRKRTFQPSSFSSAVSSTKRQRVVGGSGSKTEPRAAQFVSNMPRVLEKKLHHVGKQKSSRPLSADPRCDVNDALRKFRALQAPSKTIFELMHPDHPILSFRNIQNDVPGIVVGQRFRSRQELVLVGLHGNLQKGIHSASVTGPNGTPIKAVLSVVLSEKYEDDEDSGYTVLYTGEGGNDWSKSGKQLMHQKLSGGNAALHTSYQVRYPVRVIRFFEGEFSYSGLYDVTESKQKTGKSGFLVKQFKLVRRPGQGVLEGFRYARNPRRS